MKEVKIPIKLNRDDLKFYDVDEAPFKIYGVFKDGGKYRRMPEEVASKGNIQVRKLHANTAGGRVRFITNSSYIAIYTVLDNIDKMEHFALTGSTGYDLYANDRFIRTLMPPFDVEKDYEASFDFKTVEEREITINFPLYSDVKELYIGVTEGAFLKEPKPYNNEKPIVYYGSSITQGACASRPGMSYEAIISRKFNYDYINLGFSSGALAEEEIIDYISELEMSMLVFDYDHNAPTVEHLRETHEKSFMKIRKKHPDIPVIMLSRPKYYLTKEEKERRAIVEATYKNALANGDKNVYFIDGKALTRLSKNEGTVDCNHPTDFGFNSMAQAIIKVLKGIKI